MLPQNLTANEIRVIGCLMEKSVTTPEQYPLTLNALTNACNQKSSREPVMSLSQGTVQHTVRELEDKHLLRVEDNFKRGVEKYSQRFCNSSFGELQFDTAQYAIVCLLLLRGPQTPGELRARSGRLHEFADNNAVVEALDALNELHARWPGRRGGLRGTGRVQPGREALRPLEPCRTGTTRQRPGDTGCRASAAARVIPSCSLAPPQLLKRDAPLDRQTARS
jgi:uncharacterized protein YceH (UPF0502 family)